MTAFTRSSVSSTASAATSATSSVLRQVVAPLAALALTALLGTTAQAQGTSAASTATPAATPSAAAAPASSPASSPALNIRQIYDRLDAAGYRDLREIEWDHGRYEVKARDAQGARVKLDVDGQTGAVLRSRTQR